MMIVSISLHQLLLPPDTQPLAVDARRLPLHLSALPLENLAELPHSAVAIPEE